jgi:hypothetical protein
VVAVPQGITFATGGIKATAAASDHPALFDGKDLDPVVDKEDVIACRLADQSARDGRQSRRGFSDPQFEEPDISRKTAETLSR